MSYWCTCLDLEFPILICGSQEVMVNPVTASDGHTYELIAIQRWMEKSDRSPMTNLKLPSRELSPNLDVRRMIQEWQQKQQQISGRP